MKNLQKLILPILVIVIIAAVYFIYFSPREGLGSFKTFDPNNTAVKEIRVQFVKEKGITHTPDGGILFFVTDKDSTVMQVNTDKVPAGLESAQTIILKGHLNQANGFHAHEVLLD
jgi:cytochrome c-type biogenesis protein CcmE